MSGEPIFDFTDATYVEAIWLVAWEQTDWMAIVFRENADAPWQGKYRFRYYPDGDAFGSQDEKSGASVKPKSTDEAERARLCDVFDATARDLKVTAVAPKDAQ